MFLVNGDLVNGAFAKSVSSVKMVFLSPVKEPGIFTDNDKSAFHPQSQGLCSSDPENDKNHENGGDHSGKSMV